MNLIQSTPLDELIRSPWVLGPAVFVLWMAFFHLVKVVGIRALHRVAARTAWTWDDVLISAISTPLLIVVAAGGLVVFGRILPLAPEGDRAFDVMFAAALALALVLFVDRLCHGLLDRLSKKTPILQGTRGLIQGIVRGIIIALGLLIFLDSIGISITPILASLGIGSLAVALALKDTLANLFAGIHMIVDKPIEPGQFIRLEGGQEGIVNRVSWRSTWIRMPNNSVVVVPNSKLAESVITNYALPDAEFEFPVEVGVHYDSDLEEVERVTLEVAREVMHSVEGGVRGAEPRVRFHTFADSSVNLRVLLRAADYDSGPRLRHEFIKRLQRRYRREGIVIPYPIRTLDIPPDSAADPRLEALAGPDDGPGTGASGTGAN
jgi:small-conductance mechanosensitive channel